jgi:hypothetical protein
MVEKMMKEENQLKTELREIKLNNEELIVCHDHDFLLLLLGI